MGCASTKLIYISDQDRSKFTIVLAPQLSCLLVNKIPMSFLGLSSVVCLQQFLCWGKEKPWTCVCIKDFVLHLHQLVCTEFFTPSALKCQHFPFPSLSLDLLLLKSILQCYIEELNSVELPQCIAHLAAQTRFSSGQEQANDVRT